MHFSEVICAFRGTFVNYGSPLDTGWSDEKCVGPACAKWGSAQILDNARQADAGYCANGGSTSQYLLIESPSPTG